MKETDKFVVGGMQFRNELEQRKAAKDMLEEAQKKADELNSMLDDQADLDWCDEDWDEEPVKPKVVKPVVKRKTKKIPYPTFNWGAFGTTENSGLKSLIRAAEKQMVPDNGLDFAYQNVEFINMNECVGDYLRNMLDDIQDRLMNTNDEDIRVFYWEYLEAVIEWYLKP